MIKTYFQNLVGDVYFWIIGQSWRQGIGRCKYCCIFLTLFLYLSISVNGQNYLSDKFWQTFYFHCPLFSYSYISTIKNRLNRLNQTSIYHYDNNSLNEVFKNKLIKLLSSSLLQLNSKSFQNNNNRGLDSSWAKQMLKCLDKVPGTSKALNCGIGGDRVQIMFYGRASISL